MAAPQIYRPGSNWNIAVALIGAVFLHLGAVAVAKRAEPSQTAPISAAVEVEFFSPADEFRPAEPVEPPPELAELPPPMPGSLFQDEQPTPPFVHEKSEQRPPRIKRSAPAGARQTAAGSAKVFALSAPRPEYPYEARRQRVTGSGVAILTVDPTTGRVTEAQMWQSTGHAILDQAALQAFRKWRFRAGTPAIVQAPVVYILTAPPF